MDTDVYSLLKQILEAQEQSNAWSSQAIKELIRRSSQESIIKIGIMLQEISMDMVRGCNHQTWSMAIGAKTWQSHNISSMTYNSISLNTTLLTLTINTKAFQLSSTTIEDINRIMRNSHLEVLLLSNLR